MDKKVFSGSVKRCPGDYCSVKFKMLVTSPSTPSFTVDGGTVTVSDNGDGTFWVTSSDNVTRVAVNENKKDITEVVVHKTGTLTSMYYMFNTGIGDLTDLAFLPTCDTSNVTDMSYLCQDCRNLTNLDINNLDTSNVTNMYGVFYHCDKLPSLNVSNWDTAKVEDFGYFLNFNTECTNLDISNFSVASATNMKGMFVLSDGLVSIKMPSDMNTVKPTADMEGMFDRCYDLECLDRLDTTNATSTTHIFNQDSNLTAPNSTDQTSLEGGASWTNSSSCP